MALTLPTTHRRLWQWAWSQMASNLHVPALGAVDTAIRGYLSRAEYLAAATLGASLVTLMLWSFGFLRMGTTSLVARAAGRHDVNQTRLILAQSALLALTLGLVVALAGKLVLPLALSWVGASSDVSALAHSYASIRDRKSVV